MEAINSSSFFHYRSKKEDFDKIIKNGFSYRYSFEPLGATFANSNKKKNSPQHNSKEANEPYTKKSVMKGIAMPMVCFCDIPLLRATKHRKNYGNFCIGVDKDMMIKLFSPIINPIFYVSSEAVKQGFEELVALKRELQLNKNDLNMINGFSKGITDFNDYISLTNESDFQSIVNKGTQYFRIYFSLMQFMALCKTYTGKNYKGEDICFYDEREWRIISYDFGAFKWVYGTTADAFEAEREMKNKELEKNKLLQLCIKSDDIGKIISHIIVPTDDDILEIIKFIINSKTIFGHVVSKDTKQLIISRVTSFERIEKDY